GFMVYAGGELIITNTTNTFSGSIQLNTGTITISDPGNLPGNVIGFVNTNRTLRVNGTSAGSFTNPLSIGNPSHFIDVTNAAASTNWDGNVSGTGLFQKTGDGTINFSALTHTGGMDVQAGRVNINGSTGSSAGYSVDAGAALGGTGTINLAAGNAVTVDGSLEPGTSTGQLTINGDVDFTATGSFVVEIDGVTTAGTDYDQLIVGPTGTVSIAAGATISPAFGAFTAQLDDVVYLLDNQGGLAIAGTFQYADDESIGSFNGRKWLITYDAIAGGALDGGFGIAIYAVPEPASLGLAALAGMLLLRRRARSC
ncbi:hypothetical protein HQ590_00965, partial [bacterium]|nr:hypothetical protein [bacterium]